MCLRTAEVGSEPLPITSSKSAHLWDALCTAYDALGFDKAADGDEAFRQLVLARIIEPTSKADSLRVIEETGIVGLATRFAAPLAWRGANPDIVHETYFAIKPVGKARRRVVTVYDMIYELFAPKAKLAIAAKRAARKSRRPRNLHFRKHAAGPRAPLRHRPGTDQRCTPRLFADK
jgi:hypothetical protein